MIPSGIEPATFQFVVQCLNHRVPLPILGTNIYSHVSPQRCHLCRQVKTVTHLILWRVLYVIKKYVTRNWLTLLYYGSLTHSLTEHRRIVFMLFYVMPGLFIAAFKYIS